MSDTRWAKVTNCFECLGQYHGCPVVIKLPNDIPADCHLFRARNIPEVKRLAEAAKEYLVCHTTIFEDALTEALEAFDNGDKGEEPR